MFPFIFILLKATYIISFVSHKASPKASSLYVAVSLSFSDSLVQFNRGVVEGHRLGTTGNQAEWVYFLI